MTPYKWGVRWYKELSVKQCKKHCLEHLEILTKQIKKVLAMTGLEPAHYATGLEPAMFKAEV